MTVLKRKIIENSQLDDTVFWAVVFRICEMIKP